MGGGGGGLQQDVQLQMYLVMNNLYFHRSHYMASTNAGLCQGNRTWCYEVRGPQYHWALDLYERLNLPILPAVVEALSEAIIERAAELEQQKTSHSKTLRDQMKTARAENQVARNVGETSSGSALYGEQS